MADTPSPAPEGAKIENLTVFTAEAKTFQIRMPPPVVGRIVRFVPDPSLDGKLLTRTAKSSPVRAAIIADVIEGGAGEADIVALTVFHPEHGAVPLDRYVREGREGEVGTWHYPVRV